MEAVAYLKKHGYSFEEINVRANPEQMEEMREIFGQTKAPSMIMLNGLKLADFGVEELIPFLTQHNITP